MRHTAVALVIAGTAAFRSATAAAGLYPLADSPPTPSAYPQAARLQTATDTPAATGIEVSDAWIRWLPAGIPSGGFMTLVNRGSAPRTLVGVTSDGFGEIGIHMTSTRNGVSSMRPVDSIELEPNVVIDFASRGYHLMLMNPRGALHPGDRVTCTLHFADGHTLSVPFEVRKMP